jgi:hypothetical protein
LIVEYSYVYVWRAVALGDVQRDSRQHEKKKTKGKLMDSDAQRERKLSTERSLLVGRKTRV